MFVREDGGMSKIIGFALRPFAAPTAPWHYVREYRSGFRRTVCGRTNIDGVNASLPKAAPVCVKCERQVNQMIEGWREGKS
jgi:hypothetical protein